MLLGMLKQPIDLVRGKLAPIRAPPVCSNVESKPQDTIGRRCRGRLVMICQRCRIP